MFSRKGQLSLIILAVTVVLSFAYARGHLDLLHDGINLYSPHVLTFLCGLFLRRVIGGVLCVRGTNGDDDGESGSVYGLDHGRLHLKIPTPMWMNMGYWNEYLEHRDEEDELIRTKTLACACRNLLQEVLRTAGFRRKTEAVERITGTRRSKALIDLGFGCGDQTIYLASEVAIRDTDKEWWDSRDACVRFDHYVGITLDQKQFRVAEERAREFRTPDSPPREKGNWPEVAHVKLHCADASKPETWSEELRANIHTAITNTQEPWVLALDTLYHFSPSRWLVINHFSLKLNASFMAFDLCLSSHAPLRNRIILRILTTLMGAPWSNFVTIDQYREKLIEAGYGSENITIRDVSPHVFDPLAAYLEAQDRRLKFVGYGLGPFRVAQWMFSWWGRSGVVRGIIVVAKK